MLRAPPGGVATRQRPCRARRQCRLVVTRASGGAPAFPPLRRAAGGALLAAFLALGVSLPARAAAVAEPPATATAATPAPARRPPLPLAPPPPAAPREVQGWTKLNKPVVRRSQEISYGAFLADVRAQAVKELVVVHEGTDRALVVYKDGRVRYVQLAADDARVAELLATYGVVASPAPPEPQPRDTAAMRAAKDAAMYWIPGTLILVVYGVVQYMARTKGDFEDREKLRQQAEKERKDAKERRMAEEAAAALGGAPLAAGATPREAAPSREGAPTGDSMDFEEAAAFTTVSAKRVYARPKGAAPAEAEAVDAKGAKAGKKLRRPLSKAEGNDLNLRQDDRVTFADVAGIGEAATELMEVVDFFLKPEKYKRSGSRVPKGVLLVGPPGTGKTLLARAVAGEAGVNFFSITASEFVEMFVGVGAARVRSLFAQAKAAAPAIVFIDELDAVGRKRGGGGSGNDERDQTLNQLLSELDGFDPGSKGLVVIAATNRPDVLDAALVRPGRFDRKVFVPVPDVEGRAQILAVHASRKPLGPDVDLEEIAAETAGFTGAALGNLVNVAALAAAREQAPAVLQRHLRAALEVNTLGASAPGGGPQGEALHRLCLWRAASALAQELLPELPSLELVSVVPREASPSGSVRAHADSERNAAGTHSAALLREQAIAALAPRAAEEAVYGHDAASTSHGNSVADARALCARAVYVGAFAGKAVGHRALGYVNTDGDFLGASGRVFMPPHLAPGTQEAADAAVAVLLEECDAAARTLVATHRPALDAVTRALEERSNLTGAEVRALAGL